MSKQQLQQVQQPTYFTGGDDLLVFQSSKEIPLIEETPAKEEMSPTEELPVQQEIQNQQDIIQLPQTIELRKGLQGIQQAWIDKNQNLNVIIEQISKATKNIYNYFVSIENETEKFSKNVMKNSKNLSGQFNQQSGQALVKLTNQFIGAFQEMSSANMVIIQNSFRDFSDSIASQKKYINERQQNGIKNIHTVNEKFCKQFQKYVKMSKEVENQIEQQKQSQLDIKLVYNIAHAQKQNAKKRDLEIEAEKEEIKVQQIVSQVNILINGLPSQIQHNYNNLKDLFSQNLKHIIDSSISIHNQLYTLLPSFNQYVIDKNFTTDSIVIDIDDQKTVQERIQKKSKQIFILIIQIFKKEI